MNVLKRVLEELRVLFCLHRQTRSVLVINAETFVVYKTVCLGCGRTLRHTRVDRDEGIIEVRDL